MKLLRKWGGVLVLVWTAMVMSACTSQDWHDLVDFGRMWAQSHDILNEDGSPNLVTIGVREFGGTTGDEQTDAAIDAGKVVKNYEEAEKLNEEAINEGDPEKMKAAIDLRPGEFRYYNNRGAMLLDTDERAARKDFADADRLAAKQGRAAQLRNINSRLEALDLERDFFAGTSTAGRYDREIIRAQNQRDQLLSQAE